MFKEVVKYLNFLIAISVFFEIKVVRTTSSSRNSIKKSAEKKHIPAV